MLKTTALIVIVNTHSNSERATWAKKVKERRNLTCVPSQKWVVPCGYVVDIAEREGLSMQGLLGVPAAHLLDTGTGESNSCVAQACHFAKQVQVYQHPSATKMLLKF
jgi:hypothetical protein